VLIRGSLVRPYVTTINPLEFAAVVSICLPLAIYLARNDEPAKRRRRWLQVAIIGIAQVMTTSRTSILALIAVGIVLLPTWTPRERRRAYGVMALAVLGLFLVIHGLLGTIKELFVGVAESDSSTASRTSAWSSAQPFIAQHPWFGRGFGTFFPQTYFFTDDQYLSSLIEIGVAGLLVLLGLLATGWFTARSIRRHSTDPHIRDLAQCMAASVAVAVVSFGTFDALSFPMMASLTFMLLGCVGALWRLSREAESEIAGQPAPPAEEETVGASSAAGASAMSSGWSIDSGAWGVLPLDLDRRLTDMPSTMSGMLNISTKPTTTTAASGRTSLLSASAGVTETDRTVSVIRSCAATFDCKDDSCVPISLITASSVDCARAECLSAEVMMSTGPGELGASTTV
jgi:hypothetical protein